LLKRNDGWDERFLPPVGPMKSDAKKISRWQVGTENGHSTNPFTGCGMAEGRFHDSFSNRVCDPMPTTIPFK
jgi:hypothetical protein